MGENRALKAPMCPATVAQHNGSFSKEIDGLQVSWDSTSLGYIKTCPRLYYHQMIQGYRPRVMSHHLTFGLYVHSGLEFYERKKAEGLNHDDAVRETVRELMCITGERVLGEFIPWVSDDPKNCKTRKTLIRTVVWYLDYYENDVAETVILANGKPAVELSFRFDLDLVSPEGHAYQICGHFDKLVRMMDAVWVLDHKTSAQQLSTRYFDQFSPSNQMSLYTTASKIVLGIPAKGTIINGMQVTVNFNRFERGFAHRTEAQSEEWIADVKRWIKMAEDCAVSGNWPMNDTACSHYGGCDYRDVCGADPKVRPSILKTKFKVEIWDPTDSR